MTWNENCILSSKDDNSVFAVTDTKLYVPIVTLSAEDNVKLSKLFDKEFNIYWNKYKVIPNKTYNANECIRELLDSSYQGVKGYLFLLTIMLMESHLILKEDTFFQELK